MTLRFSLKHPLLRITVVAIAGIAAIAAVQASYTFAVVGTLADRRYDISPADLAAGIEYGAESPSLLSRVAEYATGGLLTSAPDDAIEFAAMAVRQSPRDYRLRLISAAAYEYAGRNEEADAEYHAAVELAPNFGDARWELANFLLRRGRLEESLAQFKWTLDLAPSLAGATFDLVWQKTNDHLALRKLAGDDPELVVSLALFDARAGRANESRNAIVGLSPDVLAGNKAVEAIIQTLIDKRDPLAAARVWLHSAGADENADQLARPRSSSNDGNASAVFGWRLKDSPHARTSFDDSSGGLALTFSGRDTTRLGEEMSHRVALRSGSRYRVEFRYRTQGLIADGAPRWRVSSENRVICESAPLVAAEDEWKTIGFECAPTGGGSGGIDAVLALVKTPRYSFEAPTKGEYRFGEFSLRSVGGK